MHLDADALGLEARDGDFLEAQHLCRFARMDGYRFAPSTLRTSLSRVIKSLREQLRG
jgi:hypothetical protein